MADEAKPRYTFEMKYEGHVVPAGAGVRIWECEWTREGPRPSLRGRLGRWLRLG